MFHPTLMLLRIQRNGEELLGTRITHFELLHMLSLHDRHGCVALADEEEAMARGAGLAAALAPACKAKPVRLVAGFALGWGAAFALALGAATRPCVKQMGNTNKHNTC